MRGQNKGYFSLIVWIAVFIFIGSIMGYLTRGSVDSWYTTLHRAPLTPPNYLFGIAWTILYAMIAASGWVIWHVARPSTDLQVIKQLYIAQLLLNWSWTPLFFTYHLVGTALVCLLSILVLVMFLLLKSYSSLRAVTWLLFPYFLWLLFAAYLNFYIWVYN